MTYKIECPKCDRTNFIDSEDLPANACDDNEYECRNCGYVFKFGWYAEIELREE